MKDSVVSSATIRGKFLLFSFAKIERTLLPSHTALLEFSYVNCRLYSGSCGKTVVASFLKICGHIGKEWLQNSGRGVQFFKDTELLTLPNIMCTGRAQSLDSRVKVWWEDLKETQKPVTLHIFCYVYINLYIFSLLHFTYLHFIYHY